MDELLKAKQDYAAILTQIASFDMKDDTFNVESWDKLKADKDKFARLIEQLEAKAQMAQQEAQTTQRANTPAAVLAPEAETEITPHQVSHVTFPKRDDNDTLGFSCAGELIADVINHTQYGEALLTSNNDRLQNYFNSTNSIQFNQAAGTASTLTDGIEIIPALLPGVKEYGPGTFQSMLNLFSPNKTNVDFIDFFIDPRTYTIDGLQVQRVEEDGTLTAQTTTNKLEKLQLFQVGVLAKLTRKALRNIPLLESRYMRQAPLVIMIQKLIDIISGDGIRKPIGFISDKNTAAINVTREIINKIDFTDLTNLEKQLFRQGGILNTGVYFANQSTLGELMLLTDDSGALIWKASRDMGVVQTPIQGFLNGHPLIVSEDMSALGFTGDLALVNPDGYLFAEETAGIEFAESRHFFFDQAAMGLRWIDSYGGRPYFTTSYVPRQGGENLSHFVILDAAVT